MRKSNGGPFLGFALLVSLAAPARASAQVPAEGGRSTAEDRVELMLENNNWQDVRVYVLSGSRARRIGTVTGLTTAAFTLPRDLDFLGHELQIAVSPIGMLSVHYSQRIVVNPGDRVHYRVANNLSLSSLWVS